MTVTLHLHIREAEDKRLIRCVILDPLVLRFNYKESSKHSRTVATTTASISMWLSASSAPLGGESSFFARIEGVRDQNNDIAYREGRVSCDDVTPNEKALLKNVTAKPQSSER